MPDETKTDVKETARAARSKAPDHQASATLEARPIGDPVEAAIVEAIGRRLMCGHEGSRIVEIDEYALTLVEAVKTALAAYRGEKE